MNVFTAYIAWICISQFASHKYLTPDLYVLICSTITTFINSYLPPTLEMESTHINSESDGSWDPDDACLVDLQFEGDDSVPDDCFGCLDELKIADSVHSGDTQELLRNLPRKASVSASASVPQSISFPLQHQHNLRSSHVNKKASSHANPSHLPAPPKHPTATTPLNASASLSGFLLFPLVATMMYSLFVCVGVLIDLY
jgi:hypothetical protein